MKYQQHIDDCHNGIAKCDKGIKASKLFAKIGSWCIVASVIFALIFVALQQWGTVFFWCVLGGIHYVIIKLQEGIQSMYKDARKNWTENIGRWEDCERLNNETEALKRGSAKAKEPLP